MQPQTDPFIVPKCLDSIKILYQDEHILVVNKPSGLLSLSGKHPLNIDSVHHRLIQDYPTCSMIHRLDFGTSGILLLSLNKTVNALLCKQFSNRTVTKRYTALLHGLVINDNGIIESSIAKDVNNFPLMKLCEHSGKPAKSKYRVLARYTQNQTNSFYRSFTTSTPRHVTLIEFEPITGRTHQLRVHSQFIGHPILGCDLYASDEAYFMTTRMMLHATELCFEHPFSGERLMIQCNSPF
ncbi:RluA family pseudouridine synthase [Shewanella sp. VB17]|uniref:RluA family pseudouridine synthase n=1 Tax=Shewanella sp. VB17 TaxID=2739432 RepID=UPI0015660999|nr:RluA family pseudouridine synthase [Shewanella sp. VB17]NRD72883.1 RluA family pseudouridine synthase [Shewanella sp. VB17]